VAVVPGLAPKAYPGTYGIPPLPVSSPELSSYTFTGLAPDQVTAQTLSSYDTVLLYGIRWSDIPPTGQAAINAFAATHKVVIWDSDDTGPQTYSGFVHPFTTLASGEGAPGGASVVSYPSIANPFASDSSSSPYFLDPTQLVNNKHMINHMNAIQTGTKQWVPALEAANAKVPGGAWVIGWTWGKISDGTGLVVYSGLDADSLIDDLSPNYAVREMALDLAAPVQQTPAPCSPNCKLPGTGGGGHPYAACAFAKPIPKHWVRGRVPIYLRTSVASGITVAILSHSGKVLAHGRETTSPLFRLVVHTKKLPSNRRSKLRAVAYVNGQLACTHRFGLKVDNIPPRILSLSTTTTPVGARLLGLSVSEKSLITVVDPKGHVVLHSPSGRSVRPHWVLIAANKRIYLKMSGSVTVARLIVRDRAGNTVVRSLFW